MPRKGEQFISSFLLREVVWNWPFSERDCMYMCVCRYDCVYAYIRIGYGALSIWAYMHMGSWERLDKGLQEEAQGASGGRRAEGSAKCWWNPSLRATGKLS